MSTIALPAQRAAATVELRRVLATTAATFAGAGGVIHLAQIPAHIDVPVVAAGFSLMVVAQSIFAFLTIIRPTAKLVLIGGWLHAVIAAIWLLSRTSGLAFIPGAEARQPVGLADLIANTFSVGVVAVALVANALRTTGAVVVLPRHAARVLHAIILVAALGLTVPETLTDHSHHSHATDPHTVPTDLVNNHDSEPDDGPAHTHAPP